MFDLEAHQLIHFLQLYHGSLKRKKRTIQRIFYLLDHFDIMDYKNRTEFIICSFLLSVKQTK